MKILQSTLKKIIREELTRVLSEVVSDPDSAEEWVTVTASDGEEMRLPSTMTGLDTGYAIIAMPSSRYPEDHLLYDPHWKWKDGDTVIGVPEDYPGAMPVADAYQEFHREEDAFRDENRSWEAAAWFDDVKYALENLSTDQLRTIGSSKEEIEKVVRQSGDMHNTRDEKLFGMVVKNVNEYLLDQVYDLEDDMIDQHSK